MEYKPTLGDFMPEEKDRFQQQGYRHDEAKYSINDLERLFAFFKRISGAQGNWNAEEEKQVEDKIDHLEAAIAKPRST